MDEEASKMCALIWAPIKTCIVGVAANYDICDHLSEKAMNAKELSTIINVDQSSLDRILKALFVIGVLKEEKDGKYSVTSFGETLNSKSPFSLKNAAKWVTKDHSIGLSRMAQSIRTGESTYKLIHGEEVFDYSNDDGDKQRAFSAYMSDLDNMHFKRIITMIDFSKFKRVIDIGGGYGSLIRQILLNNKETTGVLFELERVIRRAGKSLVDEFGERCQPISGDFFVSVPGEGDCYILQRIIWNFDEEEAVKILRNVRKVMKEESKLLILEPTRDRDANVLMDVYVMTLIAGAVRSTEELKNLLSKADLQLNRVIPMENALTDIVEVSIMKEV